MFAEKVAISLSMQRSGTKFFGSCLNSGSIFQSFAEVLHPNSPDQPGNFHTYLRERQINAFGLSTIELRKLLDGYLSFLLELSSKNCVHIDIMYNNLGAIAPIWSYPSSIDPIYLLSYFRSQRIGIVHIIRESPLESFVSNEVAQNRGIYHSVSESVSEQRVDLELNLDRLRLYCKRTLSARMAAQSQLDDYARYGEIFYPSFVQDNKIVVNDAVYQRVFGKHRHEDLFGDSPLRKTTKMREVNIRNMEAAEAVYEEVASSFLLAS